MNFTLKHLRYFDAALRSGSIARAANVANISQSSITAAIDLIEQSIGTELFRRVPAKGIAPTRAGKQVGERVADFLEQARLFEVDLMSLAGDPVGTLRLGCYAPTAPFILPPILARVAQRYPGIRIVLAESDMEEIADMLSSGSVDMALTYRLDPVRNLPFDPLFRARPWALLSVNSPLARRKAVSLRDLADLPMILLDLPLTESYFRSLFEAQGLTPNVVHSTKSGSVLRGLVTNDFGYSILNICGPYDRDGRDGYCAVPILDVGLSPELGLAYMPALESSAVVSVVRKIARELSQEGAFRNAILELESS